MFGCSTTDRAEEQSKWPCDVCKKGVGTSGVVEGERGVTPFPKYFLGGNAIPPYNVRTRGNGDTVAFPQIGLQRNEK